MSAQSSSCELLSMPPLSQAWKKLLPRKNNQTFHLLLQGCLWLIFSYLGNFPNVSLGIRLCLKKVYSKQINTCVCVCVCITHTHIHSHAHTRSHIQKLRFLTWHILAILIPQELMSDNMWVLMCPEPGDKVSFQRVDEIEKWE